MCQRVLNGACDVAGCLLTTHWYWPPAVGYLLPCVKGVSEAASFSWPTYAEASSARLGYTKAMAIMEKTRVQKKPPVPPLNKAN